jgi:hypothetical protein
VPTKDNLRYELTSRYNGRPQNPRGLSTSRPDSGGRAPTINAIGRGAQFLDEKKQLCLRQVIALPYAAARS